MDSGSVPFLSGSGRLASDVERPSFNYIPNLYAGDMETSYTHQGMELDEPAGAEVASSGKSAVRSCTTCSKAKAKCVKRPDQEICERCARLNKECHSREPVVRRRKVVKATRAAQLEKLEGKIEHLVNALSKSQAQKAFNGIDYGQPSPPVSSTSERSDRSQSQTQRASREELLNAMCEGEEENPATSTSSTTPAACAPELTQNDPYNLGVSLSAAEILLDRYRRLMAHANPFVILPTDATAESLNSKKPFLLHAIVTVTYFHDLPRQQAMVKQMMRDASERILINGEKSLDILQGIVTFVCWYHPHVFWAQQVTNLLHLAIAMSVELGIDRAPNHCSGFKQATVKALHSETVGRTATVEEYRTLAGVYYLTGMLASSFKKIDSMPWTKYLEESINALQLSAEHESDMLVVQLVRLQHLIQETYLTDNAPAPAHVYVQSLKADLERLRKEDPCGDPNNVFLKMQYLIAEILIYELSLIDLQDNHAKPQRAHLGDLYRCVDAVKSFQEVYFTIPSTVYLTIPFAAFGQFAHAFIILVKLVSLEVDGWDLSDLQEKLDFVNFIDETINRFEASTRSSPEGLAVNNDSFGKWAQRLRWMKQIYNAKVAGGSGENAEVDDRGNTAFKTMTAKPPHHPNWTPSQISATLGVQQPTPPDDVLSGDFFNYLDEGFWSSFGADFDMGFADMSMNAMGVPMNPMGVGHCG